MNVFNLEPKDYARIRRAMQDAIALDEAPPELADAIRARVRAEAAAPAPLRRTRWLLAAAAGLLVATAGLAVLLSPSGPSASLLRAGVAHHVHCGAVRPPPAVPRARDATAAELGPRYAGLLSVVEASAPAGSQIVDAHVCRSGSRSYVHLVCRGDDGLVSVMVTSRSAELAGAADGTTEIDGVAVVALATRDHVTFVVGGRAAAGLASAVRDRLARIEA